MYSLLHSGLGDNIDCALLAVCNEFEEATGHVTIIWLSFQTFPPEPPQLTNHI